MFWTDFYSYIQKKIKLLLYIICAALFMTTAFLSSHIVICFILLLIKEKAKTRITIVECLTAIEMKSIFGLKLALEFRTHTDNIHTVCIEIH